MGTGAVLVKNASRMMTAAAPRGTGIEVSFADGCKGLVPFADLPEIKGYPELAEIDLPNPYQLVLRNTCGEVAEIPWDFARHYCDESYRPRVEAVGLKGREALGVRLREMRLAAGVTQEGLASAAGIGRVTLARIELGEQSPRYETLVALSRALDRPVQDLVTDPTDAPAFIREERASNSFGAGKLHEKTGLPRQRKRAAQASRKAPRAKKKN